MIFVRVWAAFVADGVVVGVVVGGGAGGVQWVVGAEVVSVVHVVHVVHVAHTTSSVVVVPSRLPSGAVGEAVGAVLHAPHSCR